MTFRKYLMVLLTASILTGNLYGQDLPKSLYADQKARRIGDMLTILIMERAIAKRSSQSQKDNDNKVAVDGAVQGNLLQFLPVFGLQSNLKSKSDNREGTSQQDQLTGRISAVITAVDDNGQFEVTGSKLININGERNLMTVKGKVRSRDIRTDNTVYSYNVADAKIYYSQGGLAGKVVKRGTIPRLANVIMGGAGLALIGYVGGISALAIIRSFAL